MPGTCRTCNIQSLKAQHNYDAIMKPTIIRWLAANEAKSIGEPPTHVSARAEGVCSEFGRPLAPMHRSIQSIQAGAILPRQNFRNTRNRLPNDRYAISDCPAILPRVSF